MLALSLAIHYLIVILVDAGLKPVSVLTMQQSKLQVSIRHINIPENVSGKPVASPVSQPPVPYPEDDLTTGVFDRPKVTHATAMIEKKYYTIRELDIIPEPIEPIEPKYPSAIPPFIHGGIVRLEVLLDEEGVVTGITVLSSSPPGYFEEAAKEAFNHARFKPGMKSGYRVPTLLNLQIRFGMDAP